MKKFQLKFFRNRSLIRKIQLLSEFEKNDTYSLKSLATITQSSKRTLITDSNAPRVLQRFSCDSLNKIWLFH